jgi:hypothetical protein
MCMAWVFVSFRFVYGMGTVKAQKVHISLFNLRAARASM